MRIKLKLSMLEKLEPESKICNPILSGYPNKTIGYWDKYTVKWLSHKSKLKIDYTVFEASATDGS